MKKGHQTKNLRTIVSTPIFMSLLDDCRLVRAVRATNRQSLAGHRLIPPSFFRDQTTLLFRVDSTCVALGRPAVRSECLDVQLRVPLQYSLPYFNSHVASIDNDFVKHLIPVAEFAVSDAEFTMEAPPG